MPARTTQMQVCGRDRWERAERKLLNVLQVFSKIARDDGGNQDVSQDETVHALVPLKMWLAVVQTVAKDMTKEWFERPTNTGISHAA